MSSKLVTEEDLQSLLESIRGIISNELLVPEKNVVLSADLRDDLHAKENDFNNLMQGLSSYLGLSKEKKDIFVDCGGMDAILTVRDVCRYVVHMAQLWKIPMK